MAKSLPHLMLDELFGRMQTLMIDVSSVYGTAADIGADARTSYDSSGGCGEFGSEIS